MPRHLNGAVQSGAATALPGTQIFASPLRFVVVDAPRKVPEGWAVEVRYDGKSRASGSTVEATLVIRVKDDELKELRVPLRATIG